MAPDADEPIRWRLHLASPPEKVYELLSTHAGRARFWPEDVREEGGFVSLNEEGCLCVLAAVT